MELYIVIAVVVFLLAFIFVPPIRCRLGLHDYSPVDPFDPVRVDVCRWCGKIDVKRDQKPLPPVMTTEATTRQLTSREQAQYAPFKKDMDAVTRRTEQAVRPQRVVPFRYDPTLDIAEHTRRMGEIAADQAERDFFNEWTRPVPKDTHQDVCRNDSVSTDNSSRSDSCSSGSNDY